MILATNGEPEMCLSANLTVMLYSPGAVGKYVTVHVPSLLSSHLISVFDGPSMARAKPPEYTNDISNTYGSVHEMLVLIASLSSKGSGDKRRVTRFFALCIHEVWM